MIVSLKLRLLSTALLLGGATLLPAYSHAASCCGGGSGGSLSVPRYAWGVADISFDTEVYDGFWNRDGKHIKDPAGSDLKQYRLNLGYAQRFYKDWTASISLPYVFNDNTYSGTSSQTNGMGDTTVSLNYDLLEDQSAWRVYSIKDMKPAVTVGLSMILPTGISPYDDLNSSFDITGRGFYRLDGTLLIEKTIQPWSGAISLAYGTYFDRSINREYGKFVKPYTKGLGDRFSTSFALSRNFVIGTAGDALMLTASYAYMNEGDASYDGKVDADSGFSKQSVGTTLAYSSTDHNWGVRVGWNSAIQQDGWGKNFPTTDIFSVGVRYVFH